MTGSLIPALLCTVALLATTAYFILGSIPLLVLKHDTPMDASFVRGFFNFYYVSAIATSAATALSYALAGYPLVAAIAATLALFAIVLRKLVIPKMAQLGDKIQTADMKAVPGFRKLHVSAILNNIAQLTAMLWSLLTLGR